MIFIPQRFFSQIKPLPVVCASCSHNSQLKQPTEEQLNRLIEASYLVKLRREFDILQRTQELFDRFPASLHPVKISKSTLKTKANRYAESVSGPDQDFEDALQSDPELMKFLCPPTGSSSFYLPARLRWVQDKVEALTDYVKKDFVECPFCEAGFLRIQHPYFK